jgi:hypothetical protein
MRRRTFDFLATSIGAVLTVVLLVAGGLLLWGSNFTNTNVHNQLAQQQIYFPTAAEFAHPVAPSPGTFSEITPSMIPTVSQYAGQELTTGAQAQVYANDFIGEHIREIGGGKTYSQLSAAAMALPKGSAAYNAAEAQVQTVFQGTTLRGLLLEAYGFSVFGSIAGWAALASFILGGIMLVLTALGLLHYRKVPDDEPLLKQREVTAPLDRKVDALV